jgi:hypothetical protein
MADETKPDLFEEKNRDAIRKAFRAGRKTVELGGRMFNIERARGDAGKPFILVLPVDGKSPMGQLEIERFGSSKLRDSKGKKLISSIVGKGKK